MTLDLPKTCSMGGSKTGLVGTIGMTLISPDGTIHTARVTTGIYELGGGCYGKIVTFADAWTGSILWDTGGATPVYATEDYEVEGMIQGIQERTDNLPNDPSSQLVVLTAVGTRSPAGEYDTEMGYIPANLGDVATAAEDNTAHGAGSWETGGGGSDWGATEREQIRDALGVDGVKTKSTGGLLQKIKAAVDAVISFVS